MYSGGAGDRSAGTRDPRQDGRGRGGRRCGGRRRGRRIRRGRRGGRDGYRPHDPWCRGRGRRADGRWSRDRGCRVRLGGWCWLRRLLLDPHGVLDPIDQADMGRLRLRRGGRRFGLRLGDDDAFPGPLQELPARPAERVVVLVVVPALLADDHALVTSTVSGTLPRLTTCTLCVTCAGLAAATSASSRAALMVEGSSTVTRTMSAKFGDPGRASPAFVEVATPPVSMISAVPPVRVSTCAFIPLTVPRMR